MGKNKGKYDKQMVKSIDQIPWRDKPWGATVLHWCSNGSAHRLKPR